MVGPGVRARVEETHEDASPPRNGPDVASLRLIAADARRSQVFLARRTSVLLADDVIDLAPQKRVFFGNQTLLAQPLGSRLHQLPQFGVDVGH